MTAEIIKFGSGQRRAARSTIVPVEDRWQRVPFTVDTEEYEALFQDGELSSISRFGYRIQRGRRAKYRIAARFLERDALVEAAIRAFRTGARKKADAIKTVPEMRAQDVDAIVRVDAFRKLTGWISHQMKVGQVPAEIMGVLSIVFAPVK